jgi:RNA-directed DNA polymerase
LLRWKFTCTGNSLRKNRYANSQWIIHVFEYRRTSFRRTTTFEYAACVQKVVLFKALSLSMDSLALRSYYLDRGIPENVVEVYSEYSARLLSKKLPVIFEFEHLSLLLGLNLNTLASMISAPVSFYREFTISKRNGGKRQIFAPYESLLLAQRWILKNILDNIKIHECAHGFCKNRSIKSNASVHLNSNHLLKMDLKNFFPSIKISWVINVFLELGYSPNVAFYLASLCCKDGVLSQGAATSPALSNIILRSLDNRLTRLAKRCNLEYTRYADDLTFSGKKIHFKLIILVEKIVFMYGLNINHEKTRLKHEHGSRIITGIAINNGRLSVPGKFKRALKNEIYFIRRFGLLSHMSNQKIHRPNYLQSLLGKIGFWLYIEPTNEYAISARELIIKSIKS